MGLADQFLYTNFHELNLDWLLRKTKELNNEVENTSERMAGLRLMVVKFAIHNFTIKR